MATQSKPKPETGFEKAAERVTAINEKAVEDTQKVAQRVADLNEKAAQDALKATERVAEQTAELNQKVVATGRHTAAAYLDSYEKAVLSIADAYERAAGASKVEWIGAVASVQAELAREFTQAQTSAARELVS
jgi:hypothetical protein